MSQPAERQDDGLAAGSDRNPLVSCTSHGHCPVSHLAAAAPGSAVVGAGLLGLLRQRAADYCELVKLRLSLLVLVAAAVGFSLASSRAAQVDTPTWVLLLHTLTGIALVAFGASALNQWMERSIDGMMRRTAGRPIPAGRVAPGEALALGACLTVVGIAHLAILTHPLASVLAAVTSVLYLCVYTPLKRRTLHNTLVGAVPGALPPVIGYVAAGGGLDAMALWLFAVLFFWQLPHFYAIAWMYRAEYRAAGFRMISTADPTGRRTGIGAVAFVLVLLGVVCSAPLVGISHPGFLALTGILGIGFSVVACLFSVRRTEGSARLLMAASLVFLPTFLILVLAYRPVSNPNHANRASAEPRACSVLGNHA